MKALLLGCAAATLAASATLAADLPKRAAPPVFTPVPVFVWTGAYLGINAGYAFTESDSIRTTGIGSLQNNVVNLLRAPSVNISQDGVSAGGQVGYNYQFTPGSGVVVGVEADAQYMDLGRTVQQTIFRPSVNPNVLTNTYRSDLDFLGTVRGRVGYAFDRVLFYGTGGFAYGDVRQSVAFRTGAPLTYSGSRSGIDTGYAYGGGIEYALPVDSFLNLFRSSAVTIKGEYLHYDLGSRDLFVPSVGGPGVGYVSRFTTEGSIARAGLNFKFGTF